MSDFKPTKRVYEMMAVAAENWPREHAFDWGKTIHGDWTETPDNVAEFG